MSTGCKRSSASNPEALHAHIERELISGDLTTAQEESKSAYESFRDRRPDWAAIFRIDLGRTLIYQGNADEALRVLSEPLPTSADHTLQITRDVLTSIAELRLGHLTDAAQSLRSAEAKSSPGPISAEVFTTRGNLDLVEGDLDGAERAFASALLASRASGDSFREAGALLNLGVVALQEEHYEDALARLSSASSKARLMGAKILQEKALGSVGFIYYKLGDFERSLRSTEEAEQRASELGSAIDQVALLNNAGLSEYRLGDISAARSFYMRSLKLAESIQNQEKTLDAHVDLAFLQLRTGEIDSAEAHIRAANEIVGRLKNERAGLEPMLLNALLLTRRGDQRGAIQQLDELEERSAEVPSLRWEAEGALARIYAGQKGGGEQADVWFRRSIETFRRQRSSLTSVESTLPFLENGDDLYMGYMQHLIEEHKTDSALAVLDESRAESLTDGLKLTPTKLEGSGRGVDARAIAGRLGATVLVYSLRPKVSYLWAITPGRTEFYQLAGSETIEPLIAEQTRSILASRDLLSDGAGAGSRLYDALVRPAEGLIRKNSRVFLVGDAGLSSLNFETLLAGSGEARHYWIEDVTITNAKSLRLLALAANDRQREAKMKLAARRILLIGDPVYRADEYAELANAATEMQKVAGHFGAQDRTVLTGAAATPMAYESGHPGQYEYIHFVAHATANMTSPLDSAVVLSRGADDTSGYKLYARDVLKEGLHADLVTLSACYGSGLRNYSGEGLVGLAWAFLRAGSHRVIGAMWEVSDASTPALMDRMYGELEDGTPPDAALRDAKLAMIHGSGVFRKPLYWAPFQLYSGA
jgi:CHAT domain-containing protein/Tfp pilus assembly protein PilF